MTPEQLAAQIADCDQLVAGVRDGWSNLPDDWRLHIIHLVEIGLDTPALNTFGDLVARWIMMLAGDRINQLEIERRSPDPEAEA